MCCDVSNKLAVKSLPRICSVPSYSGLPDCLIKIAKGGNWSEASAKNETWNFWKDKTAQHEGAIHSSLFVLLPVFSRNPLSSFKILKESIESMFESLSFNLSFHLDSLGWFISFIGISQVFSCFFSRSHARIASSLGIPVETAPDPRLCTFIQV